MCRAGCARCLVPELQQRQGVATGRVEHPARELRRNLARAGPLEKGGRRRRVQAAEAELRKACREQRRFFVLTQRDQDRDRVCEQAAGGESDGLGRSPIEPLGVVDGDEKGRFLRIRRDQAEHGRADDQAVGLDPRPEPQRRPQGRGVDRGEAI